MRLLAVKVCYLIAGVAYTLCEEFDTVHGFKIYKYFIFKSADLDKHGGFWKSCQLE